MGRSARRAHLERGSASIEFLGILPFLILAALAAWQLLLVAMTATSAEGAARNASRVESRGGDGEQAALDSVSPWLRDATTARVAGTRATIRIEVPIVFPRLSTSALVVTRSAEFPAE